MSHVPSFPAWLDVQASGKRVQYDSLTSLRGVAAVLTIFIHLIAVWDQVFPSMKEWTVLQSFAQHAYLFVDFFFILSGFVMCHAYGATFSRSVSRKNYGQFLRARLARVYPLHVVILGIYVGLAMTGVKQATENPDGSILANLLLVQSLGMYDQPTWNVPAWSISVEWWTYTVFPFSFFLIQRILPSTRWFLVCLGLCVGIFAVLVLQAGHANITVGLALLRCGAGFFAGVSLYHLFQARRREPASNPITLGLFAALAATLIFLPSPVADITAFGLFCCLVYMTSKTAQASQWLNHKPLVWLGDVSYSIYLWHTLILHLVAKLALKLKERFPWSADQDAALFVGLLLVFWAALFALAYLSHKFIEVPGRRMLMGAPVNAKKTPALNAV